jgi:very-short-patch-repair endonuclease
MRRIWTIARRLRKAATDAERRLWPHLRGRQLSGMRFRRQYPIGGFIAAFACLEARLVVELDGGAPWPLAEHVAIRTQKMELCGFRVVRFWSHAVLLHTDEVLDEIRRQALASLRAGQAGTDPASAPLKPLGTKGPFDFDFGLKGCEEVATGYLR